MQWELTSLQEQNIIAFSVNQNITHTLIRFN